LRSIDLSKKRNPGARALAQAKPLWKGFRMSTVSPAVRPPGATGRRYNQEEIRALKARDNVTNFRYIAGIYSVIIITAITTIWAYQAYAAGELALGWLMAITIAAVLAMGASQHQLGGVIHEGTHYILFANRKLNELASD